MGRLILVLGGARSGKSAFAARLAAELAGDGVLFVATAEARDEEMQMRIEQHRRERPQSWQTVEAPRNVGAAIRERITEAATVLLDCLTMLVANPLMSAEDAYFPRVAAEVMAEVDGLLTCADQLDGHLIVISNEVGMGLVPPYPMGRAYRDLLGQANQALAQRADAVYLLVAGIPVQIKGEGIPTIARAMQPPMNANRRP